MNCPVCHALNDPSSQFCQTCGAQLQINSISKNEARERLFLSTFRLVLGVLGLWIIKTVLINLDFVQEVNIPDFPISVSTLVVLVILVIVAFLLIGFSGMLSSHWEIAFPGISDIEHLGKAVIWLILLGIAYKILKPFVQMINFDPDPGVTTSSGSMAILILQLILILVAIIVVFRAGVIFYHAIPLWFGKIKETWINQKPEIK